jgi:hypothetical protein
MDTNLTQDQSLKIIYEMIETSKNNLKDNSFFYLLWGWLVLAASLIHFALLYVPYKYAFLPWPILMTAGAIASAVAGYRIGSKSKVMTHVDKMIIYLWYGFLIVVTTLIVMTVLGFMTWGVTNPIIISMYGLGTFVSGGALKFKPLIIGGIGAWVIAVIAFMVPMQYVLLLTALSIVIAYLIPGYMLKAKS